MQKTFPKRINETPFDKICVCGHNLWGHGLGTRTSRHCTIYMCPNFPDGKDIKKKYIKWGSTIREDRGDPDIKGWVTELFGLKKTKGEKISHD